MPKTYGRHKKTGPHSRKSGPPSYGKPRAVADLLARPASRLATLRQRAEAAQDWLALVRSWVPAELAPHVTSAAEREQVLTIYVASAAWAARLRFMADELLARARGTKPAIEAVQAKILPPARPQR